MSKYVVTIVLENEEGPVVQDKYDAMNMITDMHEELEALWNRRRATAIYYGSAPLDSNGQRHPEGGDVGIGFTF